ncbi:MAG: hypothetical protein HYU66_28495 [Armatimonadetes bacterium]|nr:hypothetical protein [Armatimonadota bacterium]
MRSMVIIALSLPLFGCSHRPLSPDEERFHDAVADLRHARSDDDRFYALNAAAKKGFVLGKTPQAKKYAEELLELAPKFKWNWNYANAIQDGNLVLGRIACCEGRMDDAKRYLMEAGKCGNSPQLTNFGPDLNLAKDLLDKGEKDAVVEYLQLCRSFWREHDGRLDRWCDEVRAGKSPDFGPNLRD